MIRCLMNVIADIEIICQKCIEVIKKAQRDGHLSIRQAEDLLASFMVEKEACLTHQMVLSDTKTEEASILTSNVHNFVVKELIKSQLLEEVPILLLKLGNVKELPGYIHENVEQLYYRIRESIIKTLSQKYTILWVDLYAYGQLEKSVKDTRTTEVSRSILEEIIRDIIRNYDGTGRIRGIDSILSFFQDQVKAVECAIAIQRFTETGISKLIRQRAHDFQFRFAISINNRANIFIVDGDPIGGKGVTPIVRIAAVTFPEQILIGDNVFEKVKHLNYQYAGPYNFIMAKRQYRVYEVLWKADMEAKGLKRKG